MKPMRVEFGSEDVGAPQATRLTRQDKRPDLTVAVAECGWKGGGSPQRTRSLTRRGSVTTSSARTTSCSFHVRTTSVLRYPRERRVLTPPRDQCALDGVRERTDTVNPYRRGASAGSVDETGIGELLEQLLRHRRGNPAPRRFPEDVCAGSRAVHFAQDRLHRAIVDPRQAESAGRHVRGSIPAAVDRPGATEQRSAGPIEVPRIAVKCCLVWCRRVCDRSSFDAGTTGPRRVPVSGSYPQAVIAADLRKSVEKGLLLFVVLAGLVHRFLGRTLFCHDGFELGYRVVEITGFAGAEDTGDKSVRCVEIARIGASGRDATRRRRERPYRLPQ